MKLGPGQHHESRGPMDAKDTVIQTFNSSDVLIGPGSFLDATSLIPGLMDVAFLPPRVRVRRLSSQRSRPGFRASAESTGRAIWATGSSLGVRTPGGTRCW